MNLYSLEHIKPDIAFILDNCLTILQLAYEVDDMLARCRIIEESTPYKYSIEGVLDFLHDNKSYRVLVTFVCSINGTDVSISFDQLRDLDTRNLVKNELIDFCNKMIKHYNFNNRIGVEELAG